jgi:hypothetical protein
MRPDHLYHELTAYTLAHPGPEFLHQNVVDAYTAQHAGPAAKPIAVTFALIGLYLCLERGFTGRQAQRAHVRMARQRKPWLTLPLPEHRGDLTIADVLAAEPGPARDSAIRAWCISVWKSWSHAHARIAALAHAELGVPAS